MAEDAKASSASPVKFGVADVYGSSEDTRCDESDITKSYLAYFLGAIEGTPIGEVMGWGG